MTEPSQGQNDVPKVSPEQRVDPKVLELLICPLTKTRLIYCADKNELISKAAGLAFPIRDGVPLMTSEAARHIDDDTR